MNPNKNLPKRSSSMADNQTSISDEISDECVSNLEKQNEELVKLAEDMSEMVINLRKESERQDAVNKKSLHIIKTQCDKSREAIERIKKKVGL